LALALWKRKRNEVPTQKFALRKALLVGGFVVAALQVQYAQAQYARGWRNETEVGICGCATVIAAKHSMVITNTIILHFIIFFFLLLLRVVFRTMGWLITKPMD
jgi:hypothetical protein